MLAIILLPTAILLSLRLLHFLCVSPAGEQPLSEPVLRLQYQLRSAAVILFAVGTVSSAWVYQQADPDAIDTTDVISYDVANGSAIPMHAADSKKYTRDIQRIGGRLGMFFTEVTDLVTSAFHGRNLAYLIFGFALISGVASLSAARALSYYREDPSGGQTAALIPDDPPAPPGRTVRWTLKLIRRSRLVRTR